MTILLNSPYVKALSLAAAVVKITIGVAAAQDTMGDVHNDKGVITQGQIGNNYIILQTPPPIVRLLGTDPVIRQKDGTYEWKFRFVLDSSTFAANNLFVAIKKGDVIANNTLAGIVGFRIWPPEAGATMHSFPLSDTYYTDKISNPAPGEYVVDAIVNSPDAKPEIYVGVNQR